MKTWDLRCQWMSILSLYFDRLPGGSEKSYSSYLNLIVIVKTCKNRGSISKVTSNPELWNLKSAVPQSSSSMTNHKGEENCSWAPCTDPCCRCCGTTWDASPRRRHKFSTCTTPRQGDRLPLWLYTFWNPLVFARLHPEPAFSNTMPRLSRWCRRSQVGHHWYLINDQLINHAVAAKERLKMLWTRSCP